MISNANSDRTPRYLDVEGGTLAYDLHEASAHLDPARKTGGDKPLIVLAHGMGDDRRAFRFLIPALTQAGYRVAALDLRGHGQSSTGWDAYTRTALAADLIALVRHLGGPAVLVGHSIAGGAVTIAAAQAPDLVTGLVELAPFTRKQKIGLADLRVSAYRRGTTHLMGTVLFGSTTQWARYLSVAYPGVRPADYDSRQAQLTAMLSEPGRMKALQKMGSISPADAGAQLSNVSCPVLVIQGSEDPDWGRPQAEGEAIVADLSDGLGQLVMIEGAGHYPHVQYPSITLDAILPFLNGLAFTRHAAVTALEAC